jgi:hypothetical protein
MKISEVLYRMNPLSRKLDQELAFNAMARAENIRLAELERTHRTDVSILQDDLARKCNEIETLKKDIENLKIGNANLSDGWNKFFEAIAQYDATLHFEKGLTYDRWCYVLCFQPKLYYPSVGLYNKRPFLDDQGNPKIITEIIRSFGLEYWSWNEQTVTLSRRYSDSRYMENIGKDMEEATDYLQGHINRMLNTETYQRILYQNTMKGGNGNGSQEEASSKAS